jgi:hypothetical protein
MDVLLKGLIRGIMPHNIVAIVKSLGFQMRMEDGKGAHVFEMYVFRSDYFTFGSFDLIVLWTGIKNRLIPQLSSIWIQWTRRIASLERST